MPKRLYSRKVILTLTILLLPSIAILVMYYALRQKDIPTNRHAIGQVMTYAGTGEPGVADGPVKSATFSDPFGVAVDRRGNVIVADGGESNRIRRITPAGQVELIAGSEEGYRDDIGDRAQFNTPSGLAIDKGVDIIVADTSNNRIRKIDSHGIVTTVAGSGERGFKDGPTGEAQFDGPIGVAVDRDGNIFVADTYNDRIRKISVEGQVSTLAGAGMPGHSDGQADAALFDTPCGVAVDAKGNVFVADTGNDAIRRITPQGEVTTIVGHEQGNGVRLDRPMAIVVTHDGFLFVTEEGQGGVTRITPEGEVSAFAGGDTGFADGKGEAARFNGPTGLAIDRLGNLYVADTRNYLIRRITPVIPDSPGNPATVEPEKFIQPPVQASSDAASPVIPNLRAESFFTGQGFPWPLYPQDRPHEVTGVVGEARGAPGGVALHHIHSGLDVRGLMGEAALSVFGEKVSSPLPNWGFGGGNEGIALNLMSYIHIRVGRNEKDEIQDQDKFKPILDATGGLIGVRVRRGARFRVGDFIGTLNSLYHVHLNFGPWNAQVNPLQFPFAGFKDTSAPTIEPDGIEVTDSAGKPFTEKREGRLLISGDARIVVTAYDRADGNASHRKLGLYKVGYQLLHENGTPAGGFSNPLINIEFNRLPPDDASVFKLYAEGSGVSAYGTPTKFKYIVTNHVRDGKAQEGWLRASELAPGNYILKVIAEDFAGNRATGKATELPVSIERR